MDSKFLNTLDVVAVNSEMKYIPNGEIILHDDRINHKWNVKIQSFYLAQFPVTQDLYFAITRKSPSLYKGERKPVETVSWIDAVNFCNLLSEKFGYEKFYSITKENIYIANEGESDGFRLPTEAEWEYGCRAGTTKPIYGEIDRIAWYKDNSDNQTHDVGKKEPNLWGLYDMLGNVWEWCWDIYDEKVYGSYRVFRGGGWSDPARGCLAPNRRRSHPTFQIEDLGFRIARSIR